LRELRRVASLVAGLSETEFKVLESVEGMADAGRPATPLEVARSLGVSPDYAERMLERLGKARLVRSPHSRGREYLLTTLGLDLLALHSASRRGILTHIGVKVAVGKEADVYVGLTGEGRPVGVKFYRLGRTSVKKHKRFRETGIGSPNYLVASKRAALREIQALRILHPAGVPVPTPVYRNRHMVVTSLIEGELLARRAGLSDPASLLGAIAGSLKKALSAGIIHCDLSAYNILVTEGEQHFIIDWPQWVRPTHPNAETYLRRDLVNLASFFRRRFGVEGVIEGALDELLGGLAGGVACTRQGRPIK